MIQRRFQPRIYVLADVRDFRAVSRGPAAAAALPATPIPTPVSTADAGPGPGPGPGPRKPLVRTARNSGPHRPMPRAFSRLINNTSCTFHLFQTSVGRYRDSVLRSIGLFERFAFIENHWGRAALPLTGIRFFISFLIRQLTPCARCSYT
jgi:hypothetical protein